MVTVWLGQDPPPTHSGGSGTTLLVLILLGAVLWWFIGVQRDPLKRCGRCPRPNAQGHTHRCRWCGGRSERLTTAAWLLMGVGIPVPRAKHANRRHPMAVPDDYREE